MRGKLILTAAIVATGALAAALWLSPTRAETTQVTVPVGLATESAVPAPELVVPAQEGGVSEAPSCEALPTGQTSEEEICGPCSLFCPGAPGRCCSCKPGFCMVCPQAQCVPC